MFTLHLTLHGRALEPSEYESFEEMGDGLAEAFDNARMAIHPRVLAFLLALMFRDLRGRLTWRWVAEEYEIFVAHNDP